MSDALRVLQPPGWKVPRGYVNGNAGRGLIVHIAGQIGWDEQGRMADGFVAQTRQALANVLAVVAQAGGGASHVARMTWFVLDLDAYRQAGAPLGAAWRETMGRSYPAMSLVQVAGLVEPGALIEIEATALVPDPPTVDGRG